ncbi:hypothetical protein [Psychrobium sp. 1_MG-2023]|uniref:hypothetical protein n=1 Tax=Psychrobium sp. 1_MG-2023 TaxID=3062624 RepID=UPI000C336EF5|nr:hypothetical protein [Psychrobium sp. 1_MG-2023]MDP2562014.1 hypothetical protein [Psychrobium sp. 1_MG-2023]PKF58501.1 hypothetical protein CW748_03410 [Alteromonadales bacterium alter-6D02]
MNTLFASIFIISQPAYTSDMNLDPLDDKGGIEKKIEIKAKAGKPTSIFIDDNGKEHKFVLSAGEIKDIDLLKEKLALLSDDAFEKVTIAIKRLHMNIGTLTADEVVFLEGAGDEIVADVVTLKELKPYDKVERLEGLKKLEQLMFREHALAVRARIEAVHELELVEQELKNIESERHKHKFIVIDGKEADIVYNNSGEAPANSNVYKFKLDQENVVLKGHVDAILKLINHGEFSPEELDKIQQILDSKR